MITTKVDGYNMKMITIDSGSSSDILFLDALIAFSKTKDDFKKVDFPLIGFAESTTYPLGDMSRPVVFGDG